MHLHWNDDGGPWSLDARRAALLFRRGATVGAPTEATEIVSRRLCPGTPSKVCLLSDPPSDGSRRLTGAGGGSPSLRAVARVMRGAMVGAAVDATAMLSARLCPGTFANVLASCSLVSGARGTDGPPFSTICPARRAAAFVVRGTMSGAACVVGRARARNNGLPFARRGWPVVEGFEGA